MRGLSALAAAIVRVPHALPACGSSRGRRPGDFYGLMKSCSGDRTVITGQGL